MRVADAKDDTQRGRTEETSVREHICPRCGYDLSGETSRWVEACPLRGRCPECGTEFEWELIFSPGRHDLAWFSEHALQWRGFVRRWPETLKRVVVPHRFWREVDVTRRVSVGRAAAFVLVPLVVLHVVGSGVSLASSYFALPRTLSFFDVRDALTYPMHIWFYRPILTGGGGFQWMYALGPRYMRLIVIATSAWALMFAVLPTTRELAKLRWQHVARAWVYSMWWVMLLPIFRLGRDVLLAARTAIYPPTPIPAWPPPGTRFPPSILRLPIQLEDVSPKAVGAILLAWTLLWWWCACKIGWKLERASVVWALLSVAGALAGCICVLDPFALIGW